MLHCIENFKYFPSKIITFEFKTLNTCNCSICKLFLITWMNKKLIIILAWHTVKIYQTKEIRGEFEELITFFKSQLTCLIIKHILVLRAEYCQKSTKIRSYIIFSYQQEIKVDISYQFYPKFYQYESYQLSHFCPSSRIPLNILPKIMI